MMIRSCSSFILGYGGSVSEAHTRTELSNYGNLKHPNYICSYFKKLRSHKGEKPVSGRISATFTRALSESNLGPLFARHEEFNNQMPEKWHSYRVMCSKKHGLLLIAADITGELSTTDVLNEERLRSSVNFGNHFEDVACSGQDQSGGVVTLSYGEYKRSLTAEMDLMHLVEDEKPSLRERISENLANGYSSLEIGAKGMALVCTETCCRPTLLCQEQSITQGIDNEDAGFGDSGSRGKGRSSSADSISTDEYYQKTLEADPQNPLLLRNYAKFLHEVQGDMEQAEKCYGRAILASPGDGEILALYAKFIWATTNDIARAEAYFDRAVKAASEDCFVLGSYANFVWDSENED